MNRYTETEPSPLTDDADGGILTVDPAVEAAAARGGRARGARSATRPPSTPRSPSCAAVAADATRTSCPRRSPPPARARRPASGRGRCARPSASTARRPASARPPRAPATERPRGAARGGRRASARRSAAGLKILVGKPGLDGHSNGAEQIAVRARDAGMDVVYEGIRLTPAQIAASALQEGVHVVGLSILSRLAPRADPRRGRRAARARRRRAGRRRRDHPRGRRRAAARRPASPRSTRRRTSTSRGSCATSSRSWPSATAPRRAERLSGAHAGAELGARLRDGRPDRRARPC